MRYGLLGDVHGNLHALEAALEFLQSEGVDTYLCTGDLVGYGAFPNECVERVLALPGLCVAGNHDLIALGRLGDERCIPLAQESLRWTREVLADRARTQLAGLPLQAQTSEGVFVAHGSVTDPRDYVVSPAEAVAELVAAREAGFAAQVVVLGHTHLVLAVDDAGIALLSDREGAVSLASGSRHLLNPGAVGQSRERRVHARVAVLDLARREASFHAVDYDVRAAVRALRRRGRPAHSHHMPPASPWRSAAARARRRLRRAAAFRP